MILVEKLLSFLLDSMVLGMVSEIFVDGVFSDLLVVRLKFLFFCVLVESLVRLGSVLLNVVLIVLFFRLVFFLVLISLEVRIMFFVLIVLLVIWILLVRFIVFVSFVVSVLGKVEGVVKS